MTSCTACKVSSRSRRHGMGRDWAGHICAYNRHFIRAAPRVGHPRVDDHLYAWLLLYRGFEPYTAHAKRDKKRYELSCRIKERNLLEYLH